MGFLDDFMKDLVKVAQSVGEASNELKGLKSDVLSSFDGVKTDAMKLVETAKGNDIPSETEKKDDGVEPKTESPDAE